MATRLSDLAAVLHDGERGYQLAAADVQDQQLEELLLCYSRERADFAKELSVALQHHGVDDTDATTLRGSLHRAIMQLRDAFGVQRDRLVLEECERGDRQALAIYDKVLRHMPVNADERAMLVRHTNAIRASLAEIWSRLSIRGAIR